MGHVSILCAKSHALSGYHYSTDHATKEYLNLLKKWEEKKAHCNMVTAEPHENQKKNEEFDVWLKT
jgi:hypothetical protein